MDSVAYRVSGKQEQKMEDKGVDLRSLGFSIALRTEMDLGDTVV